jgi:hypothetical protein
VTNIDGVSVLAALITQEAATRRRTRRLGSTASTAQASSSDRQAPTQIEEQRKLEQRIARRIAAIDKHDPERNSKGLKVFLEAVLLEELGSGLVEDPSFHDLLARVHASMVKSPALVEPVLRAMSELLGSAGRSVDTL